MTATHAAQSTTSGLRLHLAFELSWNEWKLAFTIGHGQPARLRTVAARDLAALVREIAKAKRRFGGVARSEHGCEGRAWLRSSPRPSRPCSRRATAVHSSSL